MIIVAIIVIHIHIESILSIIIEKVDVIFEDLACL